MYPSVLVLYIHTYPTYIHMYKRSLYSTRDFPLEKNERNRFEVTVIDGYISKTIRNNIVNAFSSLLYDDYII